MPNPEMRRFQILELRLAVLPNCPLLLLSPHRASPAQEPGVGEDWTAHLSVPDVGGQHLVLLILGKEKELVQVAPMAWKATLVPSPAGELIPWALSLRGP